MYCNIIINIGFTTFETFLSLTKHLTLFSNHFGNFDGFLTLYFMLPHTKPNDRVTINVSIYVRCTIIISSYLIYAIKVRLPKTGYLKIKCWCKIAEVLSSKRANLSLLKIDTTKNTIYHKKI